jgi:hypothetical protein
LILPIKEAEKQLAKDAAEDILVDDVTQDSKED